MHKLLQNNFLKPLFLLGVLLPVWLFAQPVIHTVTPNRTTIGKFEKLELAVTLSATYNNPYEHGQVSLKAVFISPSGVQYFMDGFYFQDYEITSPNVLVATGPPGWRIRFSPDQTGLWYYYVVVADATGGSSFATQQFTCTESSRKGFITKNGSRLQYSNGETFHPIGTNIAWQWWWDGWAEYENWIDALAENGGNFTKLTMAPWIFEIEWTETGVGQYTQRQNRAWVLDWVFDQLIEKDIYCMLNPMIHDELQLGSWTGWDVNPYNQDNGGPCSSPQDFLVNETAIFRYKQKLRYINARWGYSPQVAMWEQLSEADNTGLWDNYSSQTVSWLNTMTAYMNGRDIYHRPVSSAFAIPQHDTQYWGNSNTGLTQQHIYAFIPDLEMKIYNFTKDYLGRWNKPSMVGEFALGHDVDQITELDPQGVAFHNVVWSSLFSGAAGSAMSWWWDNYLYPNNLFDHFKAPSDFLKEIDVDISQLEAVVPLCTTAGNEDIFVDPDFNNDNTEAPENQFTFEPSGLMYPTELYLGRKLYGSLFGNRRNPPIFTVNYTRDGNFKVKTGTVYLSKLKIKIDGVTVFNQSVGSNNTYGVPVSIGEHVIRVENSGTGILGIDNYQFINYAPQLRSFVLKNDTYAAGWMQNKKYNWQYLNQFGTPFPVNNGKIYLDFDNHGVFDVYWYNQDAVLDSVQTIFNTEGDLVLDAPAIVWDGAFEAKFISPVEVHFAATPLIGDAPLDVQFTDESINAGGAIDSWHWDFGDGSASTEQNPIHTYNTPGIYSVSLEIIAGQFSNSFTKENLIEVTQAIVAEFTADTTLALPGESIQFTDLSLGDPTSWLWNFGDNTLSFAENPVHVFLQPGFYTVSLFAQDGPDGDVETKTDYIQVLPPLVVAFTANETMAVVNDEIQFTDLSTGSPTYWSWDFGDGSGSANSNPVKQFNQPGTYSVSLTAGNDYFQGSMVKENFISIFDLLSADFMADTLVLWVGSSLQFTDLSFGNPTSWNWSFGDGTTSNLQHPTYAWSSAGFYTISLEVTDPVQSDIIVKENYIFVKDTLDAEFTATSTNVIFGNWAHFTDLSKGNPTSWFWQFGDGFSSNQENPLHKYKFAGNFTVRLTVMSNDSSDVEIKENYIHVLPKLVANFYADTLYALPGEQIHFYDMSPGNPTNWYWDFGNSTNNNQQNPFTTYENPGNYSVTLIVVNEFQGDTLLKENYINIIEPVVANFTVSPFESRIGEEVHFTDLSTGFPNQWEWWLGNGDTSYIKNPVTVYYEPGFYDITLIAKNEFLSDTLTIDEFLYILPPFYSQNVLLRQGWSGISTFVQPLYPAIGEIMAPVGDALFFAVNEQGIYSPALNINTLGNWDTHEGLVIFMNQPTTLTIEGYEKINNNITLSQGWSMFPIFSPCSHAATQVFEVLDEDLKVIKEIGSYKVYWPEMGIFTLDTLQSGAMYQIYLNETRDFAFPTCD